MKNHSERAVDLFKNGYNCSQAVLAAFCDETGMDFDTSIKLASSFGGGMGRLRETCGAVTGMFMVAGLKYGYEKPLDNRIKTEHYIRIQSLAEQFMQENGSIICRELLGMKNKKDIPIPDERTQEYYKKRPCVELVRHAAQIMDEYIKNNNLED